MIGVVHLHCITHLLCSGELRDAVCLFYLVLRALDTVEDDTTAFDSHETKIKDAHIVIPV